jgi:signal transduction histidine kinase
MGPLSGLRSVRRTDLVLPAAFGIAGTVEMVALDVRPLRASLGSFWLAALVLSAARALPLVVAPLVAALELTAAAVGVPVDEPASWVVVLALACLSAGLHAPDTRGGTSLLSVVAALGLVMASLGWLTEFEPDTMFGLLASVGPWAVGRSLNVALARNRELATAAERERLERRTAVAAAAAAERERIARELHDLLAHSLSVMVVQASLAEDLVRRDPGACEEALHEVQQAGRDALGETGRLLRLIRDDDDELGLQPQRGLADLADLVGEYRRAGLDVALDLDAAVTSLPMGVELSTYRIVQEALTNALRHAPGSRVIVRVARRGREVEVDVRNGPGSAASPAAVASGHGLVGVRERVALFGGTLRAGPTADGGFELAATLPTRAETS